MWTGRTKPTTGWDEQRYQQYEALYDINSNPVLDINGDLIYIDGFGSLKLTIQTNWAAKI